MSARHAARHSFLGGALSLDRWYARVAAGVAAAALVAVGLVAGANLSPAAAADPITFTADTGGTVLAGENLSITLTATNPSTTNYYNVSYQYELPVGVTYVAPTTPQGVGEPSIMTIVTSAPGVTPVVSHQLLVWSNASDLPVGDTASITFSLAVDAEIFPVGAQIVSPQAGVYAQSDPRLIPRFDSATGLPIEASFTASGQVSPDPTAVSAIKITKTEPSPESELMRGVHDNTTTYTLTVETTGEDANSDVVVVDYIPAGLEFLGCGGVDNSAPGTEEYPDSGRLGGTSIADCLPAAFVTTVNNPIPGLNGVFTRVEWRLGTVAPGATVTIDYRAGIPLLSNTMNWPDGEPAADGAQASNLDNNTGAPTRQVGEADGFVNTAVATSIYEGSTFGSTPAEQESTTSHTIEASDLSIVKSTSIDTFRAGEIAPYSLLVRTSEYVDASELVITDNVPNGLCPLVPSGTERESAAGAPTVPTECLTDGVVSGATVTKVVAEVDGSFTLTLAPADLSADTDLAISYGAFMRTNYTGGAAAPTVAGDTFTNTVSIVGSTTDAPVTENPTTVAVEDSSEVTIGSLPPAIDKRVLPRPTGAAGAAAVDCLLATGYVDASAPLPIYQLGDKVCFELTVNFSDSTMTRNAEIQDFVPTGTTYGGYAVAEGEGLLPADQVVVAGGTANAPIFHLGTTVGSDRFVEKGLTLKLYVWATLDRVSTSPVTVDITANLMKYREASTNGQVLSLRDQADFKVSPAAVATLAKTITTVEGVSPSPAADNAQVRENNVVTFALSVANGGTVAAGNDFAIRNVQLWDALPVPFDCATVSAISDAGACTDPGDPSHAVFSGSDTRSAITWTLSSIIVAGEAHPDVTYSLTVPTALSVSQSFVNNASVVAFTSPNTNGGDTEYFPRDSLATANTGKWNTATANDAATIFTPNATVAKTATPNLPGTNKTASQVVAGETVEYTYSVTVPAGTTVRTGVLADVLPSGISIPATATITANIGGVDYTPATIGSDAASAGFTLGGPTVTPAANRGKLTFPAIYTNSTSTAQVFSVTVDSVLVGVSLTSGTRTNTASFTSVPLSGGAAIPARQATAAVTVVTPVPTLSKAVSPTGTVSAGTVLTYTLVAGNTNGRPPAYDGVITDCLPAGLVFTEFLASAPLETTTAVDTSPTPPGCAAGETKLTWTLPTGYGLVQRTAAPATTVTATLQFTATVGSSAAGLASYPNTGTLVSSTLSNGANDDTVERVMTTTSAAATVNVAGATTAKQLLEPVGGKPTIGERIKYRVAITLPANVNFYQSAIIDQLPSSGSTVLVSPEMDTATFTCASADVSAPDCMSNLLVGGPTALEASGNQIGWLLGNVVKSDFVRTVTVEYYATVTDAAANARGVTQSNTAQLKWGNSAIGTTPTSAGDSFAHLGGTGSANFTVVEPRLTIDKSVSTATPQPGDTFAYSIAVTNAYDVNGATAHDVKVVDTVPAGVVVDEATISADGVWDSAARTITWDIAEIANTTPSTVVTLTYDATLAASETLGTAALTNTAQVTTYQTLTDGGRVYTANPPTDTAAVTPAFPAVTLGKSAGAGTLAYVGDAFSWRLTITNTGSGTAKTVTPTDVLPANWVYNGDATITRSSVTTEFDVATEAIASDVQTLVWPAILTVAPGEVITINYTATPTEEALTTPGAGSTISHTNTLSAVTTDATDATANSVGSYTGANAQASAHIDLADVSIVKSANETPVAGTETSAWTLTVSNAGTDVAVGPFTVSDTPTVPLPAGVSFSKAEGEGWSCDVPDATTGEFECVRLNSNDTLAASASFPPIHVYLDLAADVALGTELENVASVSSKTFDPDLENNTSSTTVAVSATSADLALTKTSVGTFTAGQSATWSIGVSNAGPSIARYPLTVTDTFPASGIDVSSIVATGTGWECEPIAEGDTTFTCTYTGTDTGLGLVAAPPITVTADILSSFTGTLSNTASVSSPTSDPNLSNNTRSTIAVQAVTATTLTLDKSRDQEIVNPGTDLTYSLVVTNTGTPDTPTVSISDPLPTGLTFVEASSVDGVWDCSTSTETVVNCVLDGPLVGGGVASVDVLVHVASDLPEGESIVNVATVTWPDGTDEGQDDSSLVGSADLSIVKSHPAGPVLAGTDLAYTLQVANAGLSDSPAGVVITDEIPAGLTPVSADGGENWDCGITDQTVTCTSLTVIADETAADPITVVVAIPADAGGTITNTATISETVVADPNLTNNTSSDPTVITRVADVTIEKSVASETWAAGTEITYTLTVTNAGPSVADSLTITDALPEGLTGLVMTSDDTETVWDCSTITSCSTDSMGVTTSQLTVTAFVAASILDGTVKTNTATVTWTDSRDVQSHTDSVDVTIVAEAALALSKTPETQDAVAGEDVSFDLTVSNDGPSDAAGPIVIEDTLPAGMRYSSVSAGWTCVPAGDVVITDPQLVTCTLGDGTVNIPNGGSAVTLTMVTTTDATVDAGTLTNTAVASSPSAAETAPASADVVFTESADLSIVKTHDAGTVRIGDDLAFGFAIANAGPSDAENVVVVDTLPAELVYVGFEGSAPEWTCDAVVEESGETTVTCELSTPILPGAEVPALVITASVVKEAYPAVVNVATIGSDTADPDPENNRSEDTVTVPPLVWLYVEKKHTGEVRIGEKATYVITVGNQGDTEDPGGFTIVDSLPQGVLYSSFSGEDVDCLASGRDVTCTFEGPLAVGQERTVNLVVTVLPGAPAEIVNTVVAASLFEQISDEFLEASDEATVLAAHPLPLTGLAYQGLFLALLSASALLLGAGLWLTQRTRQRRIV